MFLTTFPSEAHSHPKKRNNVFQEFCGMSGPFFPSFSEGDMQEDFLRVEASEDVCS